MDNATIDQPARPMLGFWLAVRPQFILAGVVPALTGLAVAVYEGAALDPLAAAVTILGVICIHGGANAYNDCHDTGSDNINRDHIAPYSGGSRVIQRGLLVLDQQRALAWILLAVGMACGLWLLQFAGVGLLWVGIGGVVLAWAYSAPPLRLTGRGLGELAVGVAFGILIPLGSYMVLTGRPGWVPVAAGLPYALLTAALLIAAQFPDRVADERAGKRNWVVRLGPGGGRLLYLAAVLAAWLSLPALVLGGTLPLTVLAALPLAVLSGLAFQRLSAGLSEAHLRSAVQWSIAALVCNGGAISLVFVLGLR